LEFYVDFLGFKIDWQHRFEANFPLYLQVSRVNACCICPSTMATPGSAVRIETDGWKRPAAVGGKDTVFAPQIQAMPWGSRT
jgi:hypothetical protein